AQDSERAHEGRGVVERLELAWPEAAGRPGPGATRGPGFLWLERADVDAPRALPDLLGLGTQAQRRFFEIPGIDVDQLRAAERPARPSAMKWRARGVPEQIGAPADEHPRGGPRQGGEEAVARQEVRDGHVGTERAKFLPDRLAGARVAERRDRQGPTDDARGHAGRHLRFGRRQQTKLVTALPKPLRPAPRVHRRGVREEENPHRRPRSEVAGGGRFGAPRSGRTAVARPILP